MIVKRTEQIIIKRSNKYYNLLLKYCNIATQLYNEANDIVLQELKNHNYWLHGKELYTILKQNPNSAFYLMPGQKSAHETLKLLEQNWKSYFRSQKDYIKNPYKYTGAPQPPKNKEGPMIFQLPNQAAILQKNNKITFPKQFKGFILKPYFIRNVNFLKFKLCRIIPKNNRIYIELIYDKFNNNIKLKKSLPALAIDLGINNFITMADSLGNTPIIINGKPLKSSNVFYNNLIKKEMKKSNYFNNKIYTSKMYTITNKRNDKIKYFLHLTTKYIIEHCQNFGISTIIIGKNKYWKNQCKSFHTFITIPYSQFLDILAYKANEVGIAVILVNEAYTSGTSFLDNELPTKENYDISRRVKRGLFKSNSGELINADVNAAYQIMKKVFCDAIKPADIGFRNNPIKITLTF